MQGRINVEVSLFGAFRNITGDASLIFEMSQGVTLAEVRAMLREEISRRYPGFHEHKLLDVSALADEKAILHNNHILSQDTKLAILPPISGG